MTKKNKIYIYIYNNQPTAKQLRELATYQVRRKTEIESEESSDDDAL